MHTTACVYSIPNALRTNEFPCKDETDKVTTVITNTLQYIVDFFTMDSAHITAGSYLDSGETSQAVME